MAGLCWNGWTCLEIAGYGWNLLEWLEMAGMAGNVWKRLEFMERAEYGFTGLLLAQMALSGCK